MEHLIGIGRLKRCDLLIFANPTFVMAAAAALGIAVAAFFMS